MDVRFKKTRLLILCFVSPLGAYLMRLVGADYSIPKTGDFAGYSQVLCGKVIRLSVFLYWTASPVHFT